MSAIKPEYIERKKQKINEDDDILHENREFILTFHRHLVVQDYSLKRQYKYLSKLPKMARQIDVPFDEAQRADIENIVLWVNERKDICDTTKLDYKTLLKRFYKWIGNGEYPDCVKFIKTTPKNNTKKLPEDMLTEKDIKKLIQHARNPRDKALIAMLWETGARIGELLNLTVGSLEDSKYGLKLVVKGKTGARRLILISSILYVNDWLNSHHKRDTKKAPLWVNIGTKNNNEAVGYRALRKMLAETAERAGISKPSNFHHFRHSRATYMANYFTEAQMCEWFGWVQGSDIPAKYVHLSGRDIDDAYAKFHDIKDEEPRKMDTELISILCPRCDYENGPTAKFCSKCGMALGIEIAMKAEDKDKQVGMRIREAMQNPEVANEIIHTLQHILDGRT
jgi:site-specific recombinase XerD